MAKHKKIAVVVAVLVVLGLAGVFAAGMFASAQQGNRPSVGSLSPDFSMGLYNDYRAGLPETIKLSDLRGKVVVMNFWASWCVECVKEADALESTWRQYRDRGVVVLGVDYLDTESAAIDYLKKFDTTYPIGVDLQEKISRQYRITGVPETFFIDKNGTLRKIVIQALTQQELTTAVEELLAQ